MGAWRARNVDAVTADAHSEYVAAQKEPCSQRRSKPFALGWAPFRGQLSTLAKKLSLTALQSMFSWLLNAGYLASNPWVLVSRRLNDQHIVLPQSRSIPRSA